MAIDATARADTFPKLLVRNARLYGGRPAYRHKDLGIWQVWTWSQVLAEARAYAVGLARLGLKRGDTIAIVGSNRPRLYWSVMAAQMLGAVPVPVYADAVADELAYVLAHAETRFAAVEDQEQVDKILSVSERLTEARARRLRRAARAARLRPRPPARDRRRHQGWTCRAGTRRCNGTVARPRNRIRQGL